MGLILNIIDNKVACRDLYVTAYILSRNNKIKLLSKVIDEEATKRNGREIYWIILDGDETEIKRYIEDFFKGVPIPPLEFKSNLDKVRDFIYSKF
jgi:hypothetical protein